MPVQCYRELLSPFLDRGGGSSSGGNPAIPSPMGPYRDREYVPVVMALRERMWLRGRLSMPSVREGPRVRPYDLFDRPTERTLRLIDVEVTTDSGTVRTKSIVVSKDAVMFMYEEVDEAR